MTTIIITWDCLTSIIEIKVHHLQIGHLTFSENLIVWKSVRIQKKLSENGVTCTGNRKSIRHSISLFEKKRQNHTRDSSTLSFSGRSVLSRHWVNMTFLTFLLVKLKMEFTNFSLAAHPMENNGDMLFYKIGHCGQIRTL